MALVPTTPNPTVYGVHLYQTSTFRYRFDEELPLIARRRAGFRSRESQAGRRKIKPGHYRPESLPPEISPVLAAEPGTGKSYPTPTNAREGRFRPGRGNLQNFAETVQLKNDLATKTPRSARPGTSMTSGMSPPDEDDLRVGIRQYQVLKTRAISPERSDRRWPCCETGPFWLSLRNTLCRAGDWRDLFSSSPPDSRTSTSGWRC